MPPVEQRIALTGRNRTVPPCSVGRRTGHAPGPAAADCPRALQTTTDDADKRQRANNTVVPLGGTGPVIIDFGIIIIIIIRFVKRQNVKRLPWRGKLGSNGLESLRRLTTADLLYRLPKTHQLWFITGPPTHSVEGPD